MLSLSKKPFFSVALRVLVLLYGAGLLQLGCMITCACAGQDTGDTVTASCCCCSDQPEGTAEGEARDAEGIAVGTEQSVCLCWMDGETSLVQEPITVKSESCQTGRDVFCVRMPFFCIDHIAYEAYPPGYLAEVSSISLSPHIATTILLL